MRHLWNDLLFLHWEVDPVEVQSKLPPGLTVDTYDGRAYVGLVPFLIHELRAESCPPVRGFSRFPEINVRTYVLHNGQDPGVWFFSLDASNAFACLGARLTFHLPYFFAEITQRSNPSEPRQTQYRSRRYYPAPLPAYAFVDYTATGSVIRSAEQESLEHFLVERYLLYSFKGGRLYVGQVHHSPYPLESAAIEYLDENLIASAGLRRPASEPHVLFARGVDVRVYGLRSV